MSPKAPGMQFARMQRQANGRYEVHGTTIIDLIRIGYGIDPDRIMGGPPWVEMERYDVIAKMPDHAPPAAGGGDGKAAPVTEASDPGGSLTLFEAVEKQLGLKLEMQKRPEQVVVIDHLEEKPTEN